MVQTFAHEEPSSFETMGPQFSVLGDVPNWDSGQTQSPSSIGFWSDPKSEFSGNESPDPDPRESQICLLGWCTSFIKSRILGSRFKINDSDYLFNCDFLKMHVKSPFKNI